MALIWWLRGEKGEWRDTETGRLSFFHTAHARTRTTHKDGVMVATGGAAEVVFYLKCPSVGIQLSVTPSLCVKPDLRRYHRDNQGAEFPLRRDSYGFMDLLILIFTTLWNKVSTMRIPALWNGTVHIRKCREVADTSAHPHQLPAGKSAWWLKGVYFLTFDRNVPIKLNVCDVYGLLFLRLFSLSSPNLRDFESCLV